MGEADIFRVHSIIGSFCEGGLSLPFHWPLGAFDWEYSTGKTLAIYIFVMKSMYVYKEIYIHNVC